MAKKFKGYYLVGNHSAVKLCFWLKKSLKDQGVCYKQKFYGIKSHRCLQMTPALICNQNCIYCWRPSLYKKIKKWDPPKLIFEGSLKGQRKLLEGFFGEKNINQKKLKEALEPNQVAISLIGEPTLYPYLDKLVKEYKKRGFSVFVVSNGTNPEVLKKIHPTFLYLSLSSFDKNSHLKINRPQKNFWKRILKSLEILRKKRCHTVLRITLIRGMNDKIEKFVPLIEKARPEFIEIKSYMAIGPARKKLGPEKMFSFKEIENFSKKLKKLIPYKIKNSSKESLVVVLERNN